MRRDGLRLSQALATAIFGAALVLAASSFAQAATAVETFQTLQAALQRDAKAKDWSATLADAQRLKTFLNGSPTAGLEVARAELRAGDQAAALIETRRFLDMGQTNDVLSSPMFQPLAAQMKPGIERNQTPISHAVVALTISDPGLLPEDIDFDPGSKSFFITSILMKKIVALDEAGRERAFAAAPDGWPMVALKLDLSRRRLWATEVAFDGFTVAPKADWGRSALLEYDLDTGKLLARTEGPPHSGLGDMVLAADGAPIVSDGDGGGVYRLRDHKLVRIDHGDFISPQTIAFCNTPDVAFVPDYVRGLARLDLKTGAVQWIATGDRYMLDGIDGLYCRGHTLVAAQNGSSPTRVISFDLDPTYSTVLSERILERAAPGHGDPTHGVFVGDAFYYIANSGWGALDDHGDVKAATHLTHALIMRTNVP